MSRGVLETIRVRNLFAPRTMSKEGGGRWQSGIILGYRDFGDHKWGGGGGHHIGICRVKWVGASTTALKRIQQESSL